MDVLGILDAVESHAAASGYFERVNGHEPKSAPTTGGLTAAVWIDSIAPVPTSGLSSTSGRLLVMVRLYSPLSEPEDAVDRDLMSAVSALFAAYCGHFTLGGLVRQVDVRGAHGAGLSARAGYLEQDSATFRVFTLTVPLIVNDLWEEAP
ncbi:hypothetical protein ACFRLW_10460 [Streptomyces sp. NPDC056728]|uniref:hypothetical protein n=1 Tax=Paenibacillus chitinolyticus TaxID=79263 RepID=UPI00366FED79